jgi:hypothetical protein
VSIRKVRNEPTNWNNPLNLDFTRLQDCIYHPLIFWLVKLAIPPPGAKDFGEAGLEADLIGQIDLFEC